jgi:hypothetical protein
MTCRQHAWGLRPRARSDPCCDERRGWRGPRASAYGDGSRASWRGDGCSAGKCACSRVFSVGCGRAPTISGRVRGWTAAGLRRPQSASPWRPRRGAPFRRDLNGAMGMRKRSHDTLGQRYGSARSRVKPTAPAARAAAKRAMIPLLRRGSTRHAGEPLGLRRFGCAAPAQALGFSTIGASRATLCTACGQLCGHRGPRAWCAMRQRVRTR